MWYIKIHEKWLAFSFIHAENIQKKLLMQAENLESFILYVKYN
jgi:hypothetical protein